MIRIIGGILIILISVLFLAAYLWVDRHSIFMIVLYSCTLVLGITQTISGIIQNTKE